MNERLWNIVVESFPKLLEYGVKVTIPLTVLSFILALAVAVVVAMIQYANIRPLLPLCRFYIWLIRGTPLLVQLYIVFYGLPRVGVVLDALPAAILVFGFNEGAYMSESMRGALESVSKGQMEAGYCVGLSYLQIMAHVVLPQAFRVAFPALSNSMISMTKDIYSDENGNGEKDSADVFGFGLQVSSSTDGYWSSCQIDMTSRNDDGSITLAVDLDKITEAIRTIEAIVNDVEVGQVFTGKVVRIMNFGAFVEIAPGKDGLVHISQLENRRVENVEDVVQIGDEIVISNQFGSITRKIKGRLISYQNGFLTYIPLNCGLCSMYIGI